MAKQTANTKKKADFPASKAGKKSASKAAAKKSTAKASGKTAASKVASAKNLQSVQNAITYITGLMNDFINSENIDNTLNGTQRLRLFGAGVRNYGFIEKSWDIVRDNPDFRPPLFNAAQMGENILEFDEYRQLYFLLEKFLAAVNEAMLIRSDVLFREALRVYGNLRELSRARVPGAEPLYRALLQFFRRRRTAEMVDVEPSIKQLEKDFNKLIHGHADGEIVIKNEKPHLVGGTRKVIDDVHKGRAAVKETAEAEIDE